MSLIRKVIEHKDNNHEQTLSYYEYDKHEKVEFDLNNFSEKIVDNKLTKNFQFVFESYVDTSEINGKPFIPFFIRENISKVYYRKNPDSQKEYILGTKMSGHLNRLDSDGIGHFMKKLYSDINIYDNQIILFGNHFPSPINSIAPNIYKFFIIDTLAVDGIDCINLGFSPRSKSDFEIIKRVYVPLMGHSDMNVEFGKFWGKAPFPLLQIPIANQSLGYQKEAFNTMNFMEFVNDEYLSVKWTHFFKGAIFNKLPLLKNLKVREVVGIKAIMGRLTDVNNPEIDKYLLKLPTDLDVNPTTHILNETPYIEASVGVTNILKFLRVDLVKRLNYLDEKYEVASLFGQRGLGLRFSAKFDF